MIVSTTGIFFWKWIWLDVALLVLLVFQIERFYDGARIHTLEERRVRTIAIPRAGPRR